MEISCGHLSRMSCETNHQLNVSNWITKRGHRDVPRIWKGVRNPKVWVYKAMTLLYVFALFCLILFARRCRSDGDWWYECGYGYTYRWQLLWRRLDLSPYLTTQLVFRPLCRHQPTIKPYTTPRSSIHRFVRIDKIKRAESIMSAPFSTTTNEEEDDWETVIRFHFTLGKN